MIYLVSYDDGEIESYASLTRQNKWDYAAKHGYRCEDSWLTSSLLAPHLSPAWRLIQAVRTVLADAKEGDWIFLSGADACIVNMDWKLEWLTGSEHRPARELLITRDHNGLNTNGFLLKVCKWSRDFIEKVWALRGQTFEIEGPDGFIHRWEEQGAFIKVLEGIGEDLGMYEHVTWLPQEITNGYEPRVYGPSYKEPTFMTHFPGKKTEERTYFIKRALGLVPSVPLPEGHWINEFGEQEPPQ